MFDICFSSMLNSGFKSQIWWNYNVDEFHKETFLLLNKIGLMEDPLSEKQKHFVVVILLDQGGVREGWLQSAFGFSMLKMMWKTMLWPVLM